MILQNWFRGYLDILSEFGNLLKSIKFSTLFTCLKWESRCEVKNSRIIESLLLFFPHETKIKREKVKKFG